MGLGGSRTDRVDSWLVRLFCFRPAREGVKEMITKLLKDESGQTMVEYGLLIALISIAVIAVLVALGPRIDYADLFLQHHE